MPREAFFLLQSQGQETKNNPEFQNILLGILRPLSESAFLRCRYTVSSEEYIQLSDGDVNQPTKQWISNSAELIILLLKGNVDTERQKHIWEFWNEVQRIAIIPEKTG
jgi:hypothetical protein